MQFAFRNQRPALLLIISFFFLGQATLWSQAQVVTPMASRTSADEVDTGANPGGQIGGRLMGFGYKLLALRCVTGQVIVGAKIRRGDVLDYLQIACAVPSCANGPCTWSSPQWGMSAGNPNGGDAHPSMMCQTNEIVSGIRGRVLAFTVPVINRRTGFDYAADIEIECSQMTSAAVAGPTGQSFYPVTLGGSGAWHHPDGGFASASPGVAANAVQNFITRPISCRNGGYGASSVSAGIANFLGVAGYPVVQAVSLFCTNIPPFIPDPTCPTTLIVAAMDNQSQSIQNQWFLPTLGVPGGATAGGSVATMEGLPASQDFTGVRITETVELDPSVAQCPVRNAAAICGDGTGLTFTLSDPDTQKSWSATSLTLPWNPPNRDHRNRFPDLHVLTDPSRRAPIDALAGVAVPAGGCTVTCRQTYSCGTGNSAVDYDPFQISYTLTHGTYRQTFAGIPVSAGKTVTLVDVHKR